jgi:hypothetical protein
MTRLLLKVDPKRRSEQEANAATSSLEGYHRLHKLCSRCRNIAQNWDKLQTFGPKLDGKPTILHGTVAQIFSTSTCHFCCILHNLLEKHSTKSRRPLRSSDQIYYEHDKSTTDDHKLTITTMDDWVFHSDHYAQKTRRTQLGIIAVLFYDGTLMNGVAH